MDTLIEIGFDLWNIANWLAIIFGWYFIVSGIYGGIKQKLTRNPKESDIDSSKADNID